MSNKKKEESVVNNYLNAVLCSLELIHSFKDYTVQVPRIADSNGLSKDILKKYGETSGLLKRNITKRKAISSIEDDKGEEYDLMPIKLHIGLACGKTYHVILGEKASLMRLEYCVGGPSVKKSGELLNVAPAGSLVISNDFWRTLVDLISPFTDFEEWSLNEESNFDEGSKNRKMSTTKSIRGNQISSSLAKKTIGTNITAGNFKDIHFVAQNDLVLSDFIQLLDSIWSATVSVDMLLPNTEQFKISSYFMEESLAKSVTNSMNSQSPSEYELIQNFNQIRNIVSVFILLKNVDINDFGSTTISGLSQKAMSVILSNTQKHGGCCRQFICDDKLTSVLLVWGMDGFAHEKGDTIHAVNAALDIATDLRNLMSDNFSIGVAYGSVYEEQILFYLIF